MKKILSILLAAMMLSVSLTACGSGEAETVAETDPVAVETEAETEPETEKETEPPKPKMVEVFTPVYTDNFDDSAATKWKSNVQLSDFKVENGYLTATSTGGGPSIAANGFELPCADIQAIRIRFINNTVNSNFQIFFTTDTTTAYCEEASFKDTAWYYESGVDAANAADSDEWNELVIYTDMCYLWEGTLKNMRIDLSNGEGSYIVDSIDFCTVTMVEEEPAA
ncbi:MAG: hypothetical protein IJX14_08215 [Clostridia bacterium]|nr:hypothetical protein [Clostridia bacterium]